MTSIFMAVREGDEGAVSRLLDSANPALLKRGDGIGSTPLETAAECGHLGVVKLLVQRGANVKAAGFMLRTALHQASDSGHKEVVAFLLEQGADAKARDWFQRTPLSYACTKGHLDAVQILLQNMGARYPAQGLDEGDMNGRTALCFAADRGHEEVVALLLRHGAKGNVATRKGMTPLMRASAEGRLGMVRTFLQHRGGQELEQRDDRGKTALRWAAGRGHEDVVSLLLRHGAQGNIACDYGITPLMHASGLNHIGVVRILLPHVGRQGLEERTPHGLTALHNAAAGGHEEMVKRLLVAGADPTVVDNEGKTPLTLAQEGPPEEYMDGSQEEELRELEERYAKCVAVFEWWEGELERRYLLQRARFLHDASMKHREQPTSQVPTYLEARVAAGHALPCVEVVSPQPQDQQGEEEVDVNGKRMAAREQVEAESQEAHAMLEYVVKALNQELLTELLEGFHTPRGEAQG